MHKAALAYLINTLTLATSMSYILLTAILILGLLAFKSTINTSVLLSSIFFIADSVVKGYLMIAHWSSLFTAGMDFRGYLGERAGRWVCGRWKWTFLRTFLLTFVDVPFRTAFLAFRATALALGRSKIISLNYSLLI